MASSRDGASKGLNGFDASAKGEGAKANEPHSAPLTGLVDELAHALGVARESFHDPRPTATAPSPSPSPRLASSTAPPQPSLPVALGRHLFDDEDDDATMPIPSTWRAQPEPPATSSFKDQLRAAALGFGTGLVLVVPLVLLLTGKLGNFSLPGVSMPGLRSSTAVRRDAPAPLPQAANQAVEPTPQEPALQRSLRPTGVATAAPAESPMQPASTKLSEPPAPSWEYAINEGKQRIASGNIVAAREALGKPAAAENGEALLLLAETFDPNMLAAWGVRDVVADAARAKALYTRAINAGVEAARARLRALE
jgi:hypothetical protein